MKSITYPFRSELIGVFASAMVGLLLLTSVDNAKAQQLPVENSSNTALIKRAFNAWAAGTGGPYNLLADDAVWTITGYSVASKTYNNREAFMSEVLLPLHARMSERLEPKITRIYEDKGTAIVLFDASGKAQDGKSYTNTYAWFLDMNGGKIVKSTAFFDAMAFNDLWTRVKPNQ
jgi:ketosteroid isomerase-like protein